MESLSLILAVVAFGLLAAAAMLDRQVDRERDHNLRRLLQLARRIGVRVDSDAWTTSHSRTRLHSSWR